MSTATLTAPTDGPIETADRSDWMSLAAAARELKIHPTSVQRAALAGSIRVRSIPGLRTMYAVDDVRRLAS